MKKKIVFIETILQDWHKKGGAAYSELDREQGKTSLPASQMNVCAPLGKPPPWLARRTRTRIRERAWRNGPEADTIHTATTDGSPIVGWLLIRYLVLLLSQIYLTHRPAQPTTPLSPAPTAVSIYYAPRPTAADCEWRYAHSRDTAR